MAEFENYIDQSESVLILADTINSFDKACSVVALCKYLNSQDKKYDLLVLKGVSKVTEELFKKYKVSPIKKLKGQNFEIEIDYGATGIEKVIWDKDEKNKKLVFKITPGSGNFTFDSVKFNEGGAKYDLLVTFGLSSFTSLGSFYDDNEHLFKECNTVVFARSKKKIGDIFVSIDSDSSYSETVFDQFKEYNIDMDKESVELLLNGTVNFRKVLEGNASSNSWGLISSMIEKGGDFNKSISNVYFSKTPANLNLQIKLMQNVKMNKKAEIVYSKVSFSDLKYYGVTKGTLDVRGRIPFNLSNDFKLAFSVYEVEKDTLRVVIESNDVSKYSANVIAGVFDGKGGEAHAQCTIKGMGVDNFEKEFFPILTDLYSIDFEKENRGDSKNIGAKGKVLTKAYKNSKNMDDNDIPPSKIDEIE